MAKVSSGGFDLELDPLVLWRDAGDPVDVRLQQAYGTSSTFFIAIFLFANLEEDHGKKEEMRQSLRGVFKNPSNRKIPQRGYPPPPPPFLTVKSTD